jgi:hypothetical protein
MTAPPEVQFASLIGSQIAVLVPRLDKTNLQNVRLRGVEPGGIWIESQDFTNAVLAAAGVPISDRTAVMFLPYYEISYALTSIEEPSFDEDALGL